MSPKILVSTLTVFITFLGAPQAAVNPSACPTGMLGYWSFDDQSNPGKDDYDNYNGTITGDVVWTSSGQVGGALQFDLNGIVDVGAVKPIANSASGGVTYTFWGKPDTPTGTQTQTGMYKSYGYADKQGDVWCSLVNTNGQLSINAMIQGAGWEPYYVWHTSVMGNPANYHQVACTYDADKLRVYFDGQLVNTADVTNGITDAANSNPLGIGYQPPFGGPDAQRDKGIIDEAAVFSRALTDQEIAALYNNENPMGHTFAAFSPQVVMGFGSESSDDSLNLKSVFQLGTSSDGINPLNEDVNLKLGAFSTTIPAGSFVQDGKRGFSFKGSINNVKLKAIIHPLDNVVYVFIVKAKGANLDGTLVPLNVQLTIGNDVGRTNLTKGAAEFKNVSGE